MRHKRSTAHNSPFQLLHVPRMQVLECVPGMSRSGPDSMLLSPGIVMPQYLCKHGSGAY
jgi:undecaprenyl pyrophosphate phosphatase UppP